MKMSWSFVLIAMISLLPLQADASIRIRNTDPSPIKVSITEFFKTWEIVIPPSGIYSLSSPSILIEIKGQKPRRANNFEEYIISDGVLGLSRRTDHSRR